MTRTIYRTATSLNGYIADKHSSLAWLFAVNNGGVDDHETFLRGVGVIVEGSTTAGTSAAADAEPDTGTSSFPVPITAIPLPAGYSGAAAAAGSVIAAELAIDLDAHLHTSTPGDAAASDASTPAHEQAAATANGGNASPAGTGLTQPRTANMDTAIAAGPSGAASFPTPVAAIPLSHALAAAGAGPAEAADTLQQVAAHAATDSRRRLSRKRSFFIHVAPGQSPLRHL